MDDALAELHGYYLEDLRQGMSAVYGKTITEADILLFAGVSGDTNPLHLNETFGQASRFRSRIAHGMLSGSFFSTVIGTKLPGPGAVYLSQSLRFRAPVRIGDTVMARCTIAEITAEKRRLRLTCEAELESDVVTEVVPGASIGSVGDHTKRQALTGPCTVDWRDGFRDMAALHLPGSVG